MFLMKKKKKKNKLSTLPLFVHLASIAITRNATWSVPFVIQNPAPVKCKTRRRVLKRSVEAAEKNHKSEPINAHVWPLDARNPRKTINPVVTRVPIKPFFFFFFFYDRIFAIRFFFVSGFYFRG